MKIHSSRSGMAGFTLLELIVVIAIITLLAGLLTPLVKSSLDDAKIAKVAALVNGIKKATTKYWYDTDTLPLETEVLPAKHDLFTSPGGLTSWKGPYTELPLTSLANPWGGAVEISDTLSGAPGLDDKFLIAGITQSGPGSELILKGVPDTIAVKIDIALDGIEGAGVGTCETTVPASSKADVYIFLFKKQ